jgi:hydrogenase maturation protease
MSRATDSVLVYGYGNPGRGDDGLGPAFAAAVEALHLPGVVVDANYQLTVEDAADIGGYGAVVFVDAAMQGPEPFWFTRVDDSAVTSIGWTSHSVTATQVVALARELFVSKAAAYALGIRGYEFADLGEGLSVRASANLDVAVAFARTALVDRQFDHYVREFAYPAAGFVTGGSTWKA